MVSRIYVISLLAFAMASFLLFNFGAIWFYGKVYIYEANPVVLLLETAMMVVILVFSAYCILEQINKVRKS
jgi:hypothetical protein